MQNPCQPADLPANYTGHIRDIVSVDHLTKADILSLLEMAAYFEAHPNSRILDGNVAATLFFEPSTRTRLSFETAVLRLGGKVIGFSDPAVSSTSKGETLNDTIKIVSNYANIIIMRHYIEGAAEYASEVTDVPVINAGDGAHQHPSQTLLDLYSIQKTQGRLDDLTITLVGDLKYGRTVHSLLMALKHFRVKYNFVACDTLRMPEEFRNYCRQHGIQFTETTVLSPEVIAESDIIYMTRVQRERFDDLDVYEMVKDLYNLDAAMLLGVAKPTMKVLHPLPRVGEINPDVDSTPYAYYFQQAKNGLFMRQAMICRAMGIEVDGIPFPENRHEPLPAEECSHACRNPKCVTNSEPMAPKYHKTPEGALACHYCEWELKK